MAWSCQAAVMKSSAPRHYSVAPILSLQGFGQRSASRKSWAGNFEVMRFAVTFRKIRIRNNESKDLASQCQNCITRRANRTKNTATKSRMQVGSKSEMLNLQRPGKIDHRNTFASKDVVDTANFSVWSRNHGLVHRVRAITEIPSHQEM